MIFKCLLFPCDAQKQQKVLVVVGLLHLQQVSLSRHVKPDAWNVRSVSIQLHQIITSLTNRSHHACYSPPITCRHLRHTYKPATAGADRSAHTESLELYFSASAITGQDSTVGSQLWGKCGFHMCTTGLAASVHMAALMQNYTTTRLWYAHVEERRGRGTPGSKNAIVAFDVFIHYVFS